jgi:hypothetical protein
VAPGRTVSLLLVVHVVPFKLYEAAPVAEAVSVAADAPAQIAAEVSASEVGRGCTVPVTASRVADLQPYGS